MGVTVAVTRTTCNVGGGNQDITTTDLGGLTPKAALFIVTEAVTDGTAADGLVLGYGAATGSSNRWAVGICSEHSQGTTDTSRIAMTDECVVKLNDGGAVDGEADFNSFIADGVRITWGNNPAAAYLLTVVLFAGTDLSAQADTFTLGNQDVEVDVNTVGFEPDLLLTATHNATFSGSEINDARFSAGVVHNGVSVSQHSFGMHDSHGAGTSAVNARVTSTYGALQTNNGALGWGADFGSFDANGFSCWARGGNANDDIGFLALYFGTGIDSWAGMEDSPNANGDWAVASPGFTPQFVMMGLTMMAALDTAYTDGSAGAFGFSTFDDDDEYCNALATEDAQGTSDTQSLSDNTAVNFPQDDGTAGYNATFTSFDANGWTLNFTAQTGADKWWCMAIEAEAGSPSSSPSPSVSPSPSPSPSPSLSPSSSPSPSVSPSVSPSPSPSVSPSPSPSLSPSSSPSPSESPSPSPSPSPSVSPSPSPSLSPSSSPSPSPSPSVSPSPSPSLSPSSSPSPSESPSPSPSVSPSPSPSLSPSASPSPSLSPSSSPSPSLSPSSSPSPSVSPSVSPSASLSPSASPSASPSGVDVRIIWRDAYKSLED